MARRILAAACLAVVTVGAGLVPGSVSPVAASSCSSWTSESAPPPTIRVFRHLSGAVDTVDFRTYAKNVLSREWIGSWTTESLRSGALAVRNYAWYQVLHWRGGVNADGACFDLRDDTWDQVYDPSKPTWSTAAAAVDDTWSWLVTKSSHIFPTYYNAGTSGEACGANANGWKAYQWGTQACGLAGKTAAQIILTYYYPGVTVSGAPGMSPTPTPTPSPSPSPNATPTAVPTATPTPAGSSSTAPTASPTAAATATPTPRPTATPTPHPTATPTPHPTATPTPHPTATPAPLPAPPANQQLPGGGQATVKQATAPPAPPSAHPAPVVAATGGAPLAVSGHIFDPNDPAARATLLSSADARRRDVYVTLLPDPSVVYGVVTTGDDMDGLEPPVGFASGTPSLDTPLAQLSTLFPELGRAIVDALVHQLVARQPLAMTWLP